MIVQLKADFEEKEKKSVKIKLSSASRWWLSSSICNASFWRIREYEQSNESNKAIRRSDKENPFKDPQFQSLFQYLLSRILRFKLLFLHRFKKLFPVLLLYLFRDRFSPMVLCFSFRHSAAGLVRKVTGSFWERFTQEGKGKEAESKCKQNDKANDKENMEGNNWRDIHLFMDLYFW
jgi:hypothetical protein